MPLAKINCSETGARVSRKTQMSKEVPSLLKTPMGEQTALPKKRAGGTNDQTIQRLC